LRRSPVIFIVVMVPNIERPIDLEGAMTAAGETSRVPRPIGAGSAGAGPHVLSSDRNRPAGRPGGRLVIVARELVRGGAAYLALRHARRLAEDYSVDVLVTGPVDAAFVREFPRAVSVYQMIGVSMRPEDGTLHTLHRIALANRDAPVFQHRYRAMLATSIFPDWESCAAACAVQADRRLVFLVDEGLVRYPALAPVERGIVERAIRDADCLLPVSGRLWQRMAERCPVLRMRPWTVLPPPVDVEAILEPSPEPRVAIRGDDRPVVLTVSRLTPDKQIGLCLQVHHGLKAAGIRFRWYVIGSGPEEGALRAEIHRLSMDHDFLILPYQENVYAWMQACDVFALFSCSEGCPTVVREAILLGRPVVMTDVNGADELIDHERTGLILGQSEDSIAGGLARIVEDASMRNRFHDAIVAADLAGAVRRETRTLLELIAADTPEPAEPRVTIVIPTYNQERFIDQAIASALAQDYVSLEVVVVDDASTDATERTARAWSFARRFRYIRNECNIGRVANYRRALLELARGEWVLTLDGDDFLNDPGFIRRACAALDRHAKRPIVFAQAGHRVHYQDGARRDVDILPPIAGDECVISGGDYLRFVFATCFFTHLGALYHRRRAIDVGFYRAELSSTDMDSLLRLALEGEVLILKTIAGCWVQHGGNASGQLCLDEIAPNVRIFRRIAGLAVATGQASWRQLDGPLTRYEAQSLIHLFGTTIGRTSRGPLALVRLLRIALEINCGLLGDRLFLSGFLRFVRPLFAQALERSRIAGWSRLGLWRFRRESSR